jgi:hypothetical protein
MKDEAIHIRFIGIGRGYDSHWPAFLPKTAKDGLRGNLGIDVPIH